MTSTPALKEWAVICHALMEGEQIIDLRKGGLREDGRHFAVRTRDAWLYPTVEHQRAELLKTPYAHWIDLADGSPAESDITLHGWVEIIEAHSITEASVIAALTSKVIWSDNYATTRFSWKSRDPLWVLILRAHRLETPLTVPWASNYGGCTSWVDLENLPQDPRLLTSEPALSDEAFAARRQGVRAALGLADAS